jgi:hypothetical protein
MDKENRNSSGNESHGNSKSKTVGNRGRDHLQGAPAKSNRQTGGSKRHERDDSSKGAEKNTTKKGPNSI